ncbi:MAG TPA: AIR synthase related protein, partial [Acidimicrobiales bacterium]|nr:AIR synthase related protein [Acidimicrobiales bacterium]
MSDAVRDERSMVQWFAERSATPPVGETWIGDDTAVLKTEAGTLLFATDSVVEGVHFFSGASNLADAGWKALVRNVSDVAAMGGVPTHAVAAVSGADEEELLAIHEGLSEASVAYGCPVVGGDLSKGAAIVVSVAILGRGGLVAPVLR